MIAGGSRATDDLQCAFSEQAGSHREDVFDTAHPLPRVATGLATASLRAGSANVIAIRLPQGHDTVRQGLISFFVDIALQNGVSARVGAGVNRLLAAHISDVGRLHRLALEQDRPDARYNAVSESGAARRNIAEAIAAGLGVPASRSPQMRPPRTAV